MKDHVTTDPLLQPYTLKHLTLKNRVMTTSHEPAYPEDGMPKARYRRYHEERAKGGVALAMTAGSAAVSRALDPRADRCPARTRLRGDDPADASGTPHQLEQGGLAAFDFGRPGP